MKEAYFLQGLQQKESLDWLGGKEVTDDGLQKIRFFLQLQPIVQVNESNLNRINFQDNIYSDYFNVFEYNNSYYVVLK